MVCVVDLAAASKAGAAGVSMARGRGTALRQKAAPVAGEKFHLAVGHLVRHELLGVRGWREGLDFSVVALEHRQPLEGRDHLVSLMEPHHRLMVRRRAIRA